MAENIYDALVFGTIATVLMFLSIFVSNLVSAPYRVWKKDKTKIEQMKAQLDVRYSADQISEAFSEGNRLYSKRIQNDDEFQDWENELLSWTTDTVELLERSLGNAERILFLEPGSAMAADIMGSYHKKHNSFRLRLELRIDVLRKILEKHGNR